MTQKIFALLPVILTAILVDCKFVPMNSSTPPLEQLKIASSEISNWRPEGDIKIFIGSELFTYNDGGAPQYLSKGLVQTGVQRVIGPDNAIVVCMVMDFGTDDNATEMYKEKKMQCVGNTLPDPRYPVTDVTVKSILGGVTGYAHYFNYYFEIDVKGFNYQEDALKTLNQFLGLYFEKIDSN
jgi:hypothetical protein